MADFRIESRSATLPYATDDAETLLATAFKLVRYPEEVGPIRLVGVSYSGLEDALQDVLFPELDQVISAGSVTSDVEVGVSDYAEPVHATVTDAPLGWRATQDVYHPEYGHGWIQGTGHGWVTVRFETRATGPGRAVSLRVDDPLLTPADPIDSLAWDEWLGQEGG